MTSIDVASLSRMQFGLTAMYHFHFVPLTAGAVYIVGAPHSFTGAFITAGIVLIVGIILAYAFLLGLAESDPGPGRPRSDAKWSMQDG
jgi:cytochrome bd ubiquinol oxidase subunit I